jgi:hypothetical protein
LCPSINNDLDLVIEAKMSSGFTLENTPYRRIYALSVGHTVECIDDSINALTLVYASKCIKENIPMENLFTNFTILTFDYILKQTLENKICSCFRKK